MGSAPIAHDPKQFDKVMHVNAICLLYLWMVKTVLILIPHAHANLRYNHPSCNATGWPPR